MLGLDVGSVALKTVVTDVDGNLLECVYRRTQGRPIETAAAVLSELVDRWGATAFDLAAGTGSAGSTICRLLDWPFVNEVICQATAVRFLLPKVRTLLEMGGQDSKLIFLPDGPANGRPLTDFAMNSNCAAGTGSFLDQQASRLGIRIEEFGKLALKSESAPSVAGRCSVFAKSDMIHLQQRATPTADIVAGLCVGLVRGLKSSLARGVKPACPIAFCGGVAANHGVVRALKQVFELEPDQLIVPECHAVTGALGAVLVGLKDRVLNDGGRIGRRRVLDLAPLQRHLEQPHKIAHRLSPLSKPSSGLPDDPAPDRLTLEARAENGPLEAYLGLDVGSISTKVAVIDSDRRVLAKCYLMTAGQPLEAVRKVLKNVGERIGDLVAIRGAASTGSGRYLTGDFIGADLVINEITAQAAAAAAIDPDVDTVFEIGGQDSKYISLDHGVVVDFEMNHACAAGTGSFLEEQAERLGINIKEQFGRLALESRHPVSLGERCTVFMESDLVGYQQKRAPTDDLVAGLSYSIVNNYMNRVVGNRRVGKRIFFQGGTAFNVGVLAAFEKVTGHKITVPPHHEVTGAIGAALLVQRRQQRRGFSESRFGGFELADTEYKVRGFRCSACSNDCEINELVLHDRKPLFYGSRCDRFNVEKNDGQSRAKIPDLFGERHRLLLRHANLEASRVDGRPTVGIPLAMLNYELLPLWATLLGELGFRVVLSPPSTRPIIRRGVEAVLSTPCFPVKVAHGHVFELIDQGVDYLWIPSVANMPHEGDNRRETQLCPYIPTLPYQINDALKHAGRSAEILKPLVRLREGRRGLRGALASLRKQFGLGGKQVRRAVEKAWQSQDAFEKACQDRGREVLNALGPNDRAIVLISRPYNGCDPGVYLDLPNKLRALGAMPIPMDFLDPRSHHGNDNPVLRRMYWKYGRRILRAAELLREDPRLHAIYLSNFSCGPDSFLTNYFRRLMAPKPALVLEIDEHSADAGVVTRLEAFLESL
ncbi:MAG TPA: acyl-CoA dehydratase activase, partial [Thermoguttaceae bacterium]|nr:acyl-CoA dehydratase activase [Thermoguttaceae bacterium]